jgi:hypothetical protein
VKPPLIVLVLCLLFAFSLSSAAPPYDARRIIQPSVQANAKDWKAAPQYAYFERDREEWGETKTYEELMILGSPYQRLFAVNGKPLSPERQRQEQEKLNAAVAQRRAESLAQRSERVADYKKERRRDHRLMQEMAKAFDFKVVGEQRLSGHEVYVLQATPRAGYKPPSDEAKVLTGMQGQLWIDQKTFHWVKVEARVIHPVSIVGFLARWN